MVYVCFTDGKYPEWKEGQALIKVLTSPTEMDLNC